MRGVRRIARRPLIVPPDRLPDHLHPVLRRVFAARAVADPRELDCALTGLIDPATLGGLDRAVALLGDAIARDARILIVGDFDADGATSTALAVRGLRALGARHVDFLVPDRFRFGYGLTPEIVAVACERQPDLLVTVDNGVSSIEGVAAAKAAGIRVLVTDHHLPGACLPAADAMVNPNLPGDAFASKSLAGVGVMFYVLLALRRALRASGGFERRGIEEPNLASLLDLVALGTVADVVPLDRNNRILVEQGLRRLRAGQACAGIAALFACAGRKVDRAVASDLAFVAGPRLNAAGRMEDMTLGIECLLTDDPGRARELARRLDALNGERRVVEARMRDEAESLLAGLAIDGGDLPMGVCLYDAAWHPGVVGIVAGRVKDELARPVIAFAREDETHIKGSARSVQGLHIRDVLDALAAHHPGLLRRFGGHAMAAGLSIAEDDYDRFRAAFDAEVRRVLGDVPADMVLHTDGELLPEEMDVATARALRYAAPWGQGFPEPVFDGTFRVCDARLVGERHLRCVVQREGGRKIDAMAFGMAGDDALAKGASTRLVYRLEPDAWSGSERARLVVEYAGKA